MSANNDLKKQIRQHQSFVEEILSVSKKIFQHSVELDLTLLVHEVGNRQRMINILEFLQRQIEKKIDAFKPEDINQEIYDALLNWRTFTSEKINKIERFDHKIVESLSKNQDEISKEIASLFRQRDLFRGYDLSSVKR